MPPNNSNSPPTVQMPPNNPNIPPPPNNVGFALSMKCWRMIQLFITFACFAVGIACVIVAHDNKTKSGLLALNVLLSVMIPFISVLRSSGKIDSLTLEEIFVALLQWSLPHPWKTMWRISTWVIDFLIGVGDQLRNPREEPQAQAEDAIGEEPQDTVGEEPHQTTQTFHGHRLPEELVTNFGILGKSHKHKQGAKSHKHKVIDFLIGVGDQLQNPGEEPQAQAEDAVGEEPQDAVGEEPHQTTQTIHLQFKCHKTTQTFHLHQTTVIDFLIGVGDQLQNPGEEPQAQAEDAVGEEPQDAVGEEPHQTTQTIHLHFACFAIGIVCVIVAHDNKIKSGLLALNVLLSVMIPFISILKSSREDRFSHVRRDFRRIVTMVFATSLEDNVAYINKELIIIHYWNVKYGSPRKCRFSLASMCHGMTLSAFVGRVIDFLIGVGDQLRNPREEPQAKAEGEEPQAQVEDAVREEPQDSVGEEPHLTTQTFHGHRLPEELVTNFGILGKSHKHKQGAKSHKHKVIDFLIGVGDQLQNPGEEPQAQAEDAVGEEPQDAVGEEPHQTTQTIHLQFKCHKTTQTFHLHQTTVIDFPIGVGDQLRNPREEPQAKAEGEEPQAQVEDAVREGPQDSVGEEPHLTTQTFHGHRLPEELVTNFGILGKSHKHKQGAKSHKHK
nr:hypothetical protein Iba_chr13aCG4300 [Ipomoea batatas]